MKKLSLLLIVVFLSFGAFAQVGKQKQMGEHHESHTMKKDADREARAMIYADKISTRLGLNMEQKEKIRQAQMHRLENQKELMAEMLNNEENMGNSAMRDRRMKIQNDFQQRMKEILTDAQYKNWTPMHEREMKMQEKDNSYEKNKNKDKKKY